MEVGIGLPNAVPDTTGDQLVEWARRADRAGFSSLGTIDRIVYPNYEPLVSLAAAAAVTERIRLATTILLAPTRQSAALLAKQAASVNALAGGRLVLGIAPGGREDDFEAAGVPFDGRGRLFDEMLDGLDTAWDGDRIGPEGKPTVILGGSVDAAYRRA
ncbi:MAG: LLM class flavin-dependent oxidoreductase, partial [Thermoleophilaceae bacterium]|nr:LLM class flavin-dependent oxidoreductase [Thermoleophilaceae bacterium]